jgi:hypothetical protein
MKRIVVPLLFGFGMTLALVIGQRMTTDAMAVVLGVAVGVAASVPTSILLVALVRRAQRAQCPADTPPPLQTMPTIYVSAMTPAEPLRLPARRQEP